MRLDDLRRSYLSPDGMRDLLPVSRAEVLQAALTEDCPYLVEYGALHSDDCATCEGRGWRVIDGVTTNKSRSPRWMTINVPLSMLEGDDT